MVYGVTGQRDADDPRQQFYVPIYERPELATHDVVAVMRDCVEFSIAESVQILSGFRGSGKTSELLRLAQELRAAGYVVVRMDGEDYFNTELPLDYGTFTTYLAAGFVDNLPLGSERTPHIARRLWHFLKRVQITPSVELPGAGLPVGGTLSLKIALQEDRSFAARVGQVMRDNRRSFRAALHDFFTEASGNLAEEGKGVVFIVDSIDHFRGRTESFAEVRESVERVFSELAEDLCLPGIHVIYTVPIYVQPALGIRRDVLNVKVHERDGASYGPGVAALTDVLRRRTPEGDIERLLGDHAHRVIEASGGLLRDLLRLTSEVALRTRILPVDEQTLLTAEGVLRQNMEAALSKEQVDILRDIKNTGQLTPARAQWADATDLMAGGAILKYPNGISPWYGVHPLLVPGLS